MTALRRILGRFLGELLIAAVRLYQLTLGRWLARNVRPLCRFTPSCSQYFILAVRLYGPFRGTRMGIARVCRCNPWNPGGFDPP